MADRQFLVARMVADTHRPMTPPVPAPAPAKPAPLIFGGSVEPTPLLTRITSTRSSGRRPRLGLSHLCIDVNYRSAIS